MHLPELTDNFLGKQVENVVAVTGTNGKTSTVNFCRQLWEAMGVKAASMGTIGVVFNGVTSELSKTLSTPEPPLLYSKMEELKAKGATHVAIEATSEGMDQSRLKGLRIKAAGFTNLTRDHIDYHKTMEDYFDAKSRLFSELLSEDGVAVINADTSEFKRIKEVCESRKIKVLSFGRNGEELKLINHRPVANGQIIEIEVFGDKYSVEVPLVGEFQVYNILCALGLVMADDIGNKEAHAPAINAIKSLYGVTGRLEFAATLKNGATIYVDYAHTPDALETVLKSLRPHAHKKLHVVFGCGGDRDKGKRAMMGEIAVRLADKAIVTDDNPRTEDASTIRSEIMTAAIGATEIGDRRAAIVQAIKNLEPDDILVVAGKGHEQGQTIGTEVFPFNDMEEVKKAVLGVLGDK